MAFDSLRPKGARGVLTKTSFNPTDNSLISLANLLIILYLISIYIWSSNETMYVFSNLLCLVTLAAMLLVISIRNITVTLPAGLLVAFSAFCITSILWAAEPSRSSTMALKTIPLLVVFSIVLYNYICLTKEKQLLIKSIYLSGIVLAVYTILSQGGLTQFISSLGQGVRLGGQVANENTVGMGTAFSLIIAYYYFIFYKDKKHLISVVLCGLVALATGSNKALIIIISGCLAILIFYAYKSNHIVALFKTTMMILGLVVLVLCLLQLPMFETISSRFSAMIDTLTGVGAESASTAERMRLAEAGLKQFFETPFCGIGIANSGIITQRVIAGYDSYLHNNYVELLACVGVVGTFLYYAGPVASIRRMIKNLSSSDAETALVLVIILAWLVIQVGLVCYSEKTSYIYLSLMMVYAYPVQSKEKAAGV